MNLLFCPIFSGHPKARGLILPRALRAFQRVNPQVSVDLRMMSPLKMLRSLRSGDLDVAFTVYVVPKDFEGLSASIGTWKRFTQTVGKAARLRGWVNGRPYR